MKLIDTDREYTVDKITCWAHWLDKAARLAPPDHFFPSYSDIDHGTKIFLYFIVNSIIQNVLATFRGLSANLIT